MNRHIALVAALGAVALMSLGTAPAFAQTYRPGQPTFDFMTATNSSDASLALVGHDVTNYPFDVMLAGVECHSATNADIFLTGIFHLPDLVKSGSKSAKSVQKSWILIAATVNDAMGSPLLAIPPTAVESCKGSWSAKDADLDHDYDGGTDVLKAGFSCGSTVATELGLDAGQTTIFNDAFGAAPGCKVVGVPTNGPFCFRGDTLVATEQGERAIRDLKPGDRVWSFDEASGREVLERVKFSFHRPGKGLRAVVAQGETLYTTDEHPFRVEGKGWTKARDIAAGDRLVVHGGSTIAVASNRSIDASTFYAGYRSPDASVARASVADGLLERVSLQSGGSNFGPAAPADSVGAPMVYNIEVEGAHNYFVGASRVLVHNK